VRLSVHWQAEHVSGNGANAIGAFA
jgi:hypothetical protein